MDGCFANFQNTIENNKGNIQIGSVAITGFLVSQKLFLHSVTNLAFYGSNTFLQFINLMVLFGFALCLMPSNDYERV